VLSVAVPCCGSDEVREVAGARRSLCYTAAATEGAACRCVNETVEIAGMPCLSECCNLLSWLAMTQHFFNPERRAAAGICGTSTIEQTEPRATEWG